MVSVFVASSPRLRHVTVASVPASHVYVRHVAAELDDGVRRLADPDPSRPGRSTEQTWWPPVMLQKGWAASQDFDVFHLQFGFDAWDPTDLEELANVLAERNKPLIYTVHDLRNPHHQDRGLHDAQLDVLVPAATTLITLTQGAAAEIRRRWGREAVVLPHPHVVPFDRIGRAGRSTGEPFRIGLHVKSLRASMAPLRLLPQLIATTRALPHAVLQVNGHRDVLDPDGARRDDALADYLHAAAARGDLELGVHDFMSDSELWDYLESLDVSVLPYRFGTHSGWLEACRDLGTAVVAPDCGYYADQGATAIFHHTEDSYDPASLDRALRHAYEVGAPGPASVPDRRRQRAWLAEAHRRIYLDALGGVMT